MKWLLYTEKCPMHDSVLGIWEPWAVFFQHSSRNDSTVIVYRDTEPRSTVRHAYVHLVFASLL